MINNNNNNNNNNNENNKYFVKDRECRIKYINIQRHNEFFKIVYVNS